MPTKSLETFSCFETLVDPRRQHGNFQHSLFDIIVLALCGTICYCETWEDIEDFGKERQEWLGKYLELKNGIPGHDTISRVISRLDTAAFFACLQQWIDSLQLDLKGRGVHIDGKTARRSFDNASNLKAMHMVSAWVDELSLCIGQVVTEQKSNEITAIPMLLEMLEIKGAVVTLDAMGCQEKIVDKIVEKKADYVITVKNNQPKLCLAIADAFEQYLEDDLKDRAVRSRKYESRNRGRLAQRTVTVAPVPEAIKASGKWKNIKTIGMVYRHREAFNTDNPRAISESDHVTYFISSLPPTASLVGKHLTKHWTVENKLHWTLDVTFTEDRSRIRKGSSPAIMGSLRRFVLSLLKRDTSMPKTSLKRKRLRAALNTDKLEAVLFGV
jgi:predicted transposase YbfD/YdcC